MVMHVLTEFRSPTTTHNNFYWVLYQRSDTSGCDGTTRSTEMMEFTPIISLELQTAEELILMLSSYTGSAYNFTVYFRGKISSIGVGAEGYVFLVGSN